MVEALRDHSNCAQAADYKDCEVIVDFTRAAAVPELVAIARQHRIPYVCCTTGIDNVPLQEASKDIPILVASNTSLSMAVAESAAAHISRLLARFNYNVHIHEEHHTRKKDAPSGSALALGAAVDRPVQYSSVRVGDIVGEHSVIFAGTSQTIRLHHSVTDRRVFAHGAIEAASWLVRQPAGYYTMKDVLAF